MTQRLTGLMAATFTPLRPDGSLNLEATGPMADFLVRQGIAGLYVCGSTGEGPLLGMDERRAVAKAYVEAARGRLPVVVHVGHSSPVDAGALAAHAQEIGASAISAVSPWYFKPGSVDVLVRCLAEIAAAAPKLPFYYYHIPVLTGVVLDMVEFLRRAPERIPTFAGLKYTAPTVDEFQTLVAFEGGRFDVLFGRDEMLLSGLAAGARGAIGSTYNFAAPLYLRLIDAFKRNDIPGARECQARSVAMIQIMYKTQFLSFAKHLMKLLGHDCGPMRLPLVTIDAQEEARMEKELRAIGYFDWGVR
jgi:N-acetylneuraminate lyase